VPADSRRAAGQQGFAVATHHPHLLIEASARTLAVNTIGVDTESRARTETKSAMAPTLIVSETRQVVGSRRFGTRSLVRVLYIPLLPTENWIHVDLSSTTPLVGSADGDLPSLTHRVARKEASQ